MGAGRPGAARARRCGVGSARPSDPSRTPRASARSSVSVFEQKGGDGLRYAGTNVRRLGVRAPEANGAASEGPGPVGIALDPVASTGCVRPTGRAARIGAVEFGRLSSVDGVDLSLPPEPARNARVLAAARATSSAASRVSIGTAGWSERGFVGRLYPPGTPAGRFLHEYARVFPTNELNSTWYGVSRERLERWAAATPAEFRFCPKLPSEVTHDRGLAGSDADMERFLGALEGLGGKLGRAWGVLPPDFGPERTAELAGFLERYAARVPLALELRQPAWFAREGALDEVLELFAAHDVVLVLTDVAGRRDVLHMRLAVPETMLRFVGNHPHPSDRTRLDDWAGRLAAWLDAGLRRAWVFLHQKHDPDAVELARHLDRRLAELTGERPLPRLAPRPTSAPTRQRELF